MWSHGARPARVQRAAVSAAVNDNAGTLPTDDAKRQRTMMMARAGRSSPAWTRGSEEVAVEAGERALDVEHSDGRRRGSRSVDAGMVAKSRGEA